MVRIIVMAMAMFFYNSIIANAQSSLEQFFGGFVKGIVEGSNKKESDSKQTISTNNSSTASRSLSQSNTSNSKNQKWRKDISPGLFSINSGNPNGAHSSITYGICSACRGTVKCGNCLGTSYCTFCNGKGYMVMASGNRLACTACSATGQCILCKGSGKCVCSQGDYPGYIPMSSTVVTPDGRMLTDKYYDSKESSSTTSSSSASSRQSSRGTCSKCNGVGFDREPIRYAPASASGWMPPHHNRQGSNCPYCNYSTDHYHTPCTGCRGFKHN